LAHSSLFPKEFPWDPAVPGPSYDINEAKRLVEEAKRAGWNGRIRLLAPNDITSSSVGLTVKTMLELAGMQVEYSNQKDGSGFVSQVNVEQDFDLAVPQSFSISDDDGAYNSIFNNLNSPGARYGYANADMDAGIDALRTAKNDDEKRAAYKRISEVFNRDAPAAVLASRRTAITHLPRVHGFQQSATAIVFFDKVWLAAS
jgi:ABC-type transport system substrate-binding protein